MSAKKITDALLAQARKLRADGRPVREIAETLGLGKSQLAAALADEDPAAVVATPKPAWRPRASKRPREDTGEQLAPLPQIDAEGDPLAIMRALLASATHTIANLLPDSPRLNPARAEARALAKGIAALERERAAIETPEELERRRRREDGETRREIEQYVVQAEREASAAGVCLWCKQQITNKEEP